MIPRKNTKVEFEYDYTYKISFEYSQSQYSIRLRDLRGTDLEFYERLFVDPDDDEQSNTPNMYLPTSFEEKFICVQRLCDISIKSLPPKVVNRLFYVAAQEIFYNFMSKSTWLRYCYALQNGRIYSLELEKEPMTKFLTICDIHREHVSKTNQ